MRTGYDDHTTVHRLAQAPPYHMVDVKSAPQSLLLCGRMYHSADGWIGRWLRKAKFLSQGHPDSNCLGQDEARVHPQC